MPAAPPPERRNLGQLNAAQRQRNTPRRGSDFLKNIDDALKENADSDFLQETKKAKNTAEIERIFPGVEEDEKTLSGMYEPALHNFPLGETVYRPIRPDYDQIPEFRSHELTYDQQRRMFPKSQFHYEHGTGSFGTPDHVSRTKEQQQRQDGDEDSDTPDFGTERTERDYAGFEQGNPSSAYPIGSERYWNHLDRYSRTSRANANEYANRLATSSISTIAAGIASRANSRTNINTSGTGSRATRRSRNPEAGPVRDTRTAAQLMAQGNPARAGGNLGGTHSFRGRAEPTYSSGRLPRQLTPSLRNIETDFTVYSYGTPIAWRSTEGHWEVPRINYSRTTQRHQSAIRRALGNSYHSPLAEAGYRISDLRQTHREQGINLPSKNYELNVGFETFHPEPPSEGTINAIVQDHIQRVINPAIERRRNSPSFQRQQNQRQNQPQLPLEGGIA